MEFCPSLSLHWREFFLFIMFVSPLLVPPGSWRFGTRPDDSLLFQVLPSAAPPIGTLFFFLMGNVSLYVTLVGIFKRLYAVLSTE